MERKEQSQDYPTAEWSIDFDNGQVLHSNLSTKDLNIRVFNNSFVEKNIFTPNDKIKGIVYISEEQGKDKEELDEKAKELIKKQNKKRY